MYKHFNKSYDFAILNCFLQLPWLQRERLPRLQRNHSFYSYHGVSVMQNVFKIKHDLLKSYCGCVTTRKIYKLCQIFEDSSRLSTMRGIFLGLSREI